MQTDQRHLKSSNLSSFGTEVAVGYVVPAGASKNPYPPCRCRSNEWSANREPAETFPHQFDVVAVARNFFEAMRELDQHEPDVAIIGSELQDGPLTSSLCQNQGLSQVGPASASQFRSVPRSRNLFSAPRFLPPSRNHQRWARCVKALGTSKFVKAWPMDASDEQSSAYNRECSWRLACLLLSHRKCPRRSVPAIGPSKGEGV